MDNPIVVLLLAAGAAWETESLQALGARRDVVVLKRCVDVADLLATAASGQAQVAVVASGAPGLDSTVIGHLRRHGVGAVAIIGDHPSDSVRAAGSRAGIGVSLTASQLAGLGDAILAVASSGASLDPPGPPAVTSPGCSLPPADSSARIETGRVLVVWGPVGSPGRSTIAAAVASELAGRQRRSILVDVDPCGGTIAQQLGILDEVSGLLAASRLSVSGQLAERIATVQRALDPRLTVVTGLPRPDRWAEVRAGTVADLLDLARQHGDVVVDSGFSLEDDPGRDIGTRPGRNSMTLEALEAADELLVVGTPDPVGLARLVRGLGEVGHLANGAHRVVVINRMRPGLGWSEKQIGDLLAAHLGPAELLFLPDDRAAVDRSLVAGRTLLEGGESPLTRAVAALVDALPGFSPAVESGRRRSVRRRTTSTDRRR